jgi:hypothetical protein
MNSTTGKAMDASGEPVTTTSGSNSSSGSNDAMKGGRRRRNNMTMRKNTRRNNTRRNNMTMRKNRRNNTTMRRNNMMGGAKVTVGTKAQVWHGTAKHTSGGLTKKDLMKHKGKIVSKKKHTAGLKAIKKLRKMGYVAKKGTFKLFKKH